MAGGRGKDKEWGWGSNAVTAVTADLRNGGPLPEGVEVIGGDPAYEEQEDGSQALIMPEGAYLKLAIPHVRRPAPEPPRVYRQPTGSNAA